MIGAALIWGISIAFWACYFIAVKRGIFHIPDEESGAPEGASNFQFQYPSISGCKLSVRVSSKQSVSQDAG